MSLHWFEARYSSYGERIRPVELKSATEKTVTSLSGRREGRFTAWGSYHPTFEEAKAFLVSKAERDVESARSALKRAQDDLGNVKGLRPPSSLGEVSAP